MRVLIWKYEISPEWELLEQSLNQKKTVIYPTRENEKERIAYLFETTDSQHMLLLIAGVQTEKVAKAWSGYCLPEAYTFALHIDCIKQLSNSEISLLTQLYELSTVESARHNLETNPTYFFTADLPQKELFAIFFDTERYSLKKYFAVEYDWKSAPLLLPLNFFQAYHQQEDHLDSLAQKSQYAQRPIALDRPHPYRNEFQRDKERLIHSKGFRRMVDKAQIYNTTKGGHYRKRLTHSLEVSQIARAVARQLRLHEDLTEAIALGHDVGHTPFGHEGERQLDLIMSGGIKLAPQHQPENLGGFKHNYQALRLLNYIEEKYREYEGLNLTYQVLEGILKHTSLKKCKKEKRHCAVCLHQCFDINEFLIIGNIEKLHLEVDFCSTLEGQVVEIADEIAQRGHDLDDGLASGVITIDELMEELNTPILRDLHHNLHNILQPSIARKIVINRKDLQNSIMTPAILNFFIERLIKNARMAIEEYKSQCTISRELGVIGSKLIFFHENEQRMLDSLEQIIRNRIINSQEINCFDGNAAYIIRKLFKAYYCNPRQLPDNTLSRINKDLELLNIPHIEIRRSNKDAIATEILLYQGNYPYGMEAQGYIKHKIFMRNIADLIGGMTDEFARSQFKKLYLP
ncbi:deoxyguanosinetriphosphate triphosphohydrolase [Lucifera butyrica]|uniref:Deoxyguanosinetriphosphate triphosphohydrolase n=1 Tax=Lucifera butyrica TaxID=1351585 RepID=A0A498R3Y7_9FIRM|nr:dNTP triphosphohydrolase [Lucifera butyrica]VBB04982.1 deoxyguanosinetriphosphate triphosphohydrolase [Lucifera butyrica]